MRRGSRYWGGLGSCLGVAALLAASAVEARASALRPNLTYSTSGGLYYGSDDPLSEVVTGRITGTPTLTFQGVQDQTVQAGVPFPKESFPIFDYPDGSIVSVPLGRLFADLPSEGETIYENARFFINVRVDAVDGNPLIDPAIARLEGTINGTIRAEGESSLNIGFWGITASPPYSPKDFVADSMTIGELRHHLFTFSLDQLPATMIFSEPDSLRLETTMVSEDLNVPEPSTWLVFSTTLLGGWLLQRRRNAKPSSTRARAA